MIGQINSEPNCRTCDGYMHGGCVDPASAREFLSTDDRACRLYRVRAMRPDAREKVKAAQGEGQ